VGLADQPVQQQFSRIVATIGTVSPLVSIMRLPIILALIVVITLPKDVRGFVDDMSAQARVATASISHFLDRSKSDGTVKVAEASVGNVLKARHDTSKNLVGNIR
jgi:hypothetical protein